jgi:hypothetical protein
MSQKYSLPVKTETKPPASEIDPNGLYFDIKTKDND